MLFMSFEICNNREFLCVASAANKAFVAMGSFIVVFDTQNSLKRLKLFVILVPLAAGIWAGVPLDKHWFRAGLFIGFCEGCWGFVLVPMTSHVHP